MGDVEAGGGAIHDPGGLIVCEGGFCGGGECAQPKAIPAVGFSNLGDPFAPRPLPHTSEDAAGVIRASFALHTALLRALRRDLPDELLTIPGAFYWAVMLLPPG